MSEHATSIQVKPSVTDPAQSVYRPRCSCGWRGFTLALRDSAQIMADHHVNEIIGGFSARHRETMRLVGRTNIIECPPPSEDR